MEGPHVHSRKIAAPLFAIAAIGVWTSSAIAAAPHVVQPGETLWSISASNNLTTRTVAAYNGLPEDAQVVTGETIEVPTVEEGAAALAATPPPTAPDPGASQMSTPDTGDAPASTIPSAPGMGHISSPWGQLHLAPEAADAWNAMRAEALRIYGVELQPNGPLSAYRTYDQQAELYDLFLSGQGAPANPPGSSSHELGLAVDVATPEMREIIDEIGPRFGWGKIHAPGEWWHVDYLGG
jgi:LAS superfamily LD-carboxypeptidase LdcB